MATFKPTAEQLGVLAPPVEELQAKALSAWESLREQITLAKQESTAKTFNYRDKKGEKDARSYLYELRLIAGSIEKARVAAKAVYLERGRTIDTAAKDLDKDLRALIRPHQNALDAIQAEEEARIAAHRSVLEFIAALPTGVTTAADAGGRIAELEEIDTLQQQEADRAELEALRRKEEEREAADRAERLRLEGEQRERDRAEQQRQRDADAAREREAQALAAAEASRRAQEDAERRAAEAEERERQAAEAREEAERAAAEAQATRQAELIESLIGAMKGKRAAEVAAAMVEGSFHPAVFIDWSRV